MRLVCRDRELDLSRPAVMGVLNVTPDSFSDGGLYTNVEAAVTRALAMLDEGAAIIDVGGESTRPGAAPVAEADEIERVVPVIAALRARSDAPLSVDTSKPGVIRAACAAGADMVNDVRALRVEGALRAVAESGAGICLMHMQGTPRTMQDKPSYRDVVSEVRGFLGDRVADCRAAGIAAERIAIDPGFGFGKTLEHNLALLGSIADLCRLDRPVLIGVSRKSMFRALLGERPPDQRLPAGLSAAAIAVWQGATIVRSHDVRATCDAVAVAHSAQAAR